MCVKGGRPGSLICPRCGEVLRSAYIVPNEPLRAVIEGSKQPFQDEPGSEVPMMIDNVRGLKLPSGGEDEVSTGNDDGSSPKGEPVASIQKSCFTRLKSTFVVRRLVGFGSDSPCPSFWMDRTGKFVVPSWK